MKNLFETLTASANLGPLESGHYVQIGMGLGFYVPEAAFQAAQAAANESRKVQFLGVTKAGEPITGTRESIFDHPESAGLVAWIVPAGEAN